LSNKVEFKILVSGSEEIKKSFSNLAAGLEEFEKATKSIARDLSQVGSTVALLGASISGPLVFALNSASKSSADAAVQVKRFQDTTLNFQKEIASSVIPVFSKMNDVLGNLFAAFQRIDQTLRDQILQGALVTGVFLAFSGAITIVVAKVIGLASNIASLSAKFLVFAAANPLILAVGASIVALTVLMFKFKAVSDVVLSTFQVMFILLQNGFLTVRAALEKFVSISLDNISKIFVALSNIPGPMQEQFAAFGQLLNNQSALLNRFAYQDIQAVNDKAAELGQILATGQGTWSMGFEDLKTKVSEFFAVLTGGTEEGSIVQTFTDGFKTGLDEIGAKLSNLGLIGADIAKTFHAGMSAAISDVILGVKSAKEAFADFGRLILKTIVDYVAQWIAFQILAKSLALIGVTFAVTQAAVVGAAWAPAAALASLATLGGNAAPASAAMTSTVALGNLLAVPKFAEGSGPLKDDTLGLFNKREIVVPTTFSDAIRSGELSLSGGGQQQSSEGITFDFRGAQFNGITDTLVEQIFTKASENIRNRTLAFVGAG